MSSQNVILLIEDDANDAFFLERALEEVGFPGKLAHFTDTDLAKEYLSGDNPTPQVIIADSAVSPRGSGVDLLEWVRQGNIASSAPFIIMTGGMEESVIRRAEKAGVHCIFTKAGSYKKTAEQLRQVFSTLPAEQRDWLK